MKTSKFNRDFCEPLCSDDYSLVLSRELYTKEQAQEIFSKDVDFPVRMEDIQEKRVRFCIMADSERGNDPCWWIIPKHKEFKKGTKPVWVIDFEAYHEKKR